MLARTLAVTNLLNCLAITFFMCNVAIGQEKQPDVDPSEALAEVKLPQAELDTDSVAALTKAIEVTAEAGPKAGLHAQRAKQYMRAQQWNKAAADYRKAADLKPQDSMHWMRGAVLLQLADNRMHFDQLANEMLKHFKETENPYAAERTAKMCWLPVPPVDERELAEKLANFSMERRRRPWGEYYPTTRALGHFRYGEYDEALKAIAESDRRNAAKEMPQIDLDTMNRMLAAMSLAKLERHDEALAHLQRGTATLRKNVADVDQLYDGGFWNDWLFAKLLHDEARQMVSAKQPVGYDSPQAVYAAAKRAYGNQDWITFAKCHDDDGQTTHAALALMSAFVKFGLIADEEERKEKFDTVEAICKKHELKPLLTFIGQLGMFGKIDFGNLKKEQNDRIVNYLRTVKNKPAFIAAVHALLEEDSEGARIITLPLIEADLVRIDIDGDKAQAVMQGKSDDEPKIVQFRRIDGRWIISAK